MKIYCKYNDTEYTVVEKDGNVYHLIDADGVGLCVHESYVIIE